MAARKVTATVTPAESNKVILTDKTGRKLEYEPLSITERWRLSLLLGPENSANRDAFGMAAAAIGVRSIDGMACLPPQTKQQLEAAITRMGDDGLESIGVWVLEQASLGEGGEEGGDVLEQAGFSQESQK